MNDDAVYSLVSHPDAGGKKQSYVSREWHLGPPPPTLRMRTLNST
jgi:hypothetical protein